MARESFELRTVDVARVRERIAGLLGSFRLDARWARHDSHVRHDPLGPLSFITIAYGQPVEITTQEMHHGLALQRALSGSIAARADTAEHVVAGMTAQVVRRDVPLTMRASAECRMLLVSIGPEDLARELALLGTHLEDLDASLPPVLPLTGAGAGLARCLDFLYLESRRADGVLGSDGSSRAATQMLLSLVLQARQARPGSRWAGRPGYVKRAEDFMAANLGNTIGVGDVVVSAGVCVRTLYHGFTAYHGVAPMTWLREQRLERVRAELASASPDTTTVSEVAMRWGCPHLGRFAALYRARFGESPSRTLRRR